MIRVLEKLGFVQTEGSSPDFKIGSAVVLMILMLTFVGTSIYVLSSSFS